MFDVPENAILVTENLPATFQDIKSYIGNSLSLHVFQYPNGNQINAKIKCTFHKGGLIKTARLHLVIQEKDKIIRMFKEQANGNFKQS